MSTTHHTPHATRAPLTSAGQNAPLGQLDAAIVAEEAARAAADSAEAATRLAADDALQADIDAVVLAGSGFTTTLDAEAAAAQKVIPLTSTTGITAGESAFITDGTNSEAIVVASVSAGVSVTAVANLANTYAAGSVFSLSPVELALARESYASLDERLDGLAKLTLTKAVGSVVPGILEWVHEGASGYLMHLHTGPGYSGTEGTTAVIGIGVGDGDGVTLNEGGTGILISNKKSGTGLLINNQATIDDAAAIGLHGFQSSTFGNLIYLEQLVAGAGPLMRLINQVAGASAGQTMAIFTSTATNDANWSYTIGRIYADTGKLTWHRDIRIDGSAALDVSGPTNVNENVDHVKVASSAVKFYKYTGSSSWYPYQIAESSTQLLFQGGGATGTIGSETFNQTFISLNAASGPKIGFLGATAVVRQVVTGSRGANAALASVLTALANLGLITDSSS